MNIVQSSQLRVWSYVHGTEERLIHAPRGENLDGLEAATVLKKVKKEKRLIW